MQLKPTKEEIKMLIEQLKEELKQIECGDPRYLEVKEKIRVSEQELIPENG